MWAQLISMRVKPGHEGDVATMFEELHAAEQPDSGLLRTMGFQDEKDPRRAFVLVVFESEERAREREQDPRRAEGLVAVRARMAELFDGAPEFVDLRVIHDETP